MKKAFYLVILMAILFSGCNKDKAKNETPCQILASEFKELTDKNSDITLEDLASKLMNNSIIEFAAAEMPVEQGYLNGFSAQITGFDEGVMFGPMIGAIPFIGYVFKVSSDKEGFIKQLKDSADLRWNVCTQADELMTAENKDYVFFVMAPESFDEE